MAFSLSQPAANEVRSRLSVSSVEDPVASLNDAAAAPASLVEMLDHAEESDRLGLAQAEYARLEAELDFRLGVGVYASSQCRPQDLVQIAGVQFALPKEMLEFLASVSLEYVAGAFLLREGERVFVSLRQFAESKSNAT